MSTASLSDSSSSKQVTFPVWVGSLSSNVNEGVLMSLFSKYGPVKSVHVMRDPATKKSKEFGYINYLNREVAEVAARDMNGRDICGKKIKTKGPPVAKVTSPVSVPVGKTDYRPLTDCLYYIKKGECNPKNGQVCLYRHFYKARWTKEICDKWLDKNCSDETCSRQHPRRENTASKVDGTLADGDCPPASPSFASQEQSSHKVALERCLSHNAFKCFGQCGIRNCNTHFQDERALLDHIEEHTGVTTFPPCSVCDAVFFNKEEHFNHLRKGHSGLIPSPKIVGSEPIGVFWDIENCRIPKGKSAVAIVHKIREKYYPGRREVEFMCVCDTTKEKKEVLEELNKAQINVLHINAASKNAADDKLKQALRRFAQAHPPPATIVLISGDINFCPDLSDLRHRHNLHIILLHNRQASEALLTCAHQHERFDVFCSSVPAAASQSKCEASTELLISNLPTVKHKQVKGRLNGLAANTGGKVVRFEQDESTGASLAVLKFPDSESAHRGLQRIDKEIVIGCQIRACFYDGKAKDVLPSPSKHSPSTPANVEVGKGVGLEANKPNPGLKKESLGLEVKNINSNLTKVACMSTPNIELSARSAKKNAPRVSKTQDAECLLNKSRSKDGSDLSGAAMLNVGFSQVHGEPGVKPADVLGLVPCIPVRPDVPPVRSEHLPVSPIMPLHHPRPTLSVMPQNLQVAAQLGAPVGNLDPSGLKLGVDVLVTNIDESVTQKELRKKLTSLFREHSKVISVIFAGQNKPGNLHAFVRVPKLQDANLCIAKLNNAALFGRRIAVSSASAKENELFRLKSEVSRILMETYAGWLPIDDFLATFKRAYHRSFNVLTLERMKDLVYIDGRPGIQFVCLLHFPVGLLKLKVDKDFEREVASIVYAHNRRVPFASFPGLYWSYLNKPLPLDQNGELLITVIQSQQIVITGNTPETQAVCYRKPRPKRGQKYPISDFQADVLKLLKVSPMCRIALAKFIPLYHQFFGRQCSVADYGRLTLMEMFEAIKNVVQVAPDQTEGNAITMTHKCKHDMLNHDLVALLEAREQHNLPVANMITAYYRFYGHKLYHRNYGYQTLEDLLNDLSPTMKVLGPADSKVLVLADDRPQQDIQHAKKQVEQEVLAIIDDQPGKQLLVDEAGVQYLKKYGRQLPWAGLGFPNMSKLLESLDGLQIKGPKDQRIVQAVRVRPNFQEVWGDVVALLEVVRSVLLINLPQVFRDIRGKEFMVDDALLAHFLRKIPDGVLLLGEGPNRVLLCNTYSGDCPEDVVSDEIVKLLSKREKFKMFFPDAVMSLRELGLAAYIGTVSRLAEKGSRFEFTGNKYLQMKDLSGMFEENLIRVFSDIPDSSLLLNDLGNYMTKLLEHPFRVSDYGHLKLQSLLNSLSPDIVDVFCKDGQTFVGLKPLGQVCAELCALLEESASCLMLANLPPAYQKKFGKQLKAADYNCTKISNLLAKFPAFFKFYGEKQSKVCVLKSAVPVPLCKGHDPVLARTVRYNGAINPDIEPIKSAGSNDSYLKVEQAIDDGYASDLLQFAESMDATDKEDAGEPEWWMEPLPEDLLAPAIEPELSQPVSYDLISFTEFESPEIRNGGLDDSTLAKPIPENPFSFFKHVSKWQESNDESILMELSPSALVPSTASSLLQPDGATGDQDLMRLLLDASPRAFNPLDPVCSEPFSAFSESLATSMTDTSYSCLAVLEDIDRSKQQDPDLGPVLTPELRVRTGLPEPVAEVASNSTGASEIVCSSNQVEGALQRVRLPKLAAKFDFV